MKAFEVFYKYGRFFQKTETEIKRINFVEGKEIIVLGKDDSFLIDEKVSNIKPLNESDKAKEVRQNFGEVHHRIFQGKTKFFFRIGKQNNKKKIKSHEFFFVCEILEDLHIYLQHDKKGDEYSHWTLADCKCQLIDCIHGGLDIYENITADSLNQLFSNVVMYYFPMERSGACNAFSTFFPYNDTTNVFVESKQLTKNINQKRIEFVNEYNTKEKKESNKLKFGKRIK